MRDINLGYEHLLTRARIWNIAQNKPSLIVKDFQLVGVPPVVSNNILLARGVYKWLSVRRRLIKLKQEWKGRIRKTLAGIAVAKKAGDTYRLGYCRGYLKAYNEAKREVRALCHSQRWQAPDFDRKSHEHLSLMEEQNNGKNSTFNG